MSTDRLSFSHKVKEELYKQISPARHCQLAELSALLTFSGGLKRMAVPAENEMFVRKCFTLLEKTFKITGYVSDGQGGRHDLIGIPDPSGKIRESLRSSVLLERACCKRAYLRGAFIAAGSVSDPQKSYHFEIAAAEEAEAFVLTELFDTFEIPAKITLRKHSHLVYIKDGEKIADALNVMEAPVALMAFENTRIYKNVANTINRQVNCETANLSKTISAAVKQREAIEYAVKLPAYEELPEPVREVARLRLQFPDVSLKELGEMCDPKVGKSGVNHRLRRIMELAETGSQN